MKYSYVLLVVFLIAGCASVGKFDRFRSENRTNLVRLEAGMSKQQALDTMGYKSVKVYYSNYEHITLNNPYKSETLRVGDRLWEVVYYVTDAANQRPQYAWGWTEPGPIAKNDLTPLVFEDGKLIGWGNKFLETSGIR